jgi:hypothetical protein
VVICDLGFRLYLCVGDEERQTRPNPLAVLHILVAKEPHEVLLLVFAWISERSIPRYGVTLTVDPGRKEAAKHDGEAKGRDDVAEQQLRSEGPVEEPGV